MKLIPHRTKIIYDKLIADKSIYDKQIIDNLDKFYKIMISNNNKLYINPNILTFIHETLFINDYKFNISRHINIFFQIDKTIRTLVHTTVFNIFNFILKSEEYLYENKLIPFIKTFQSNIFQDYLQKLGSEIKEISFNRYRQGLIM